jgi:hypothetical protein
MSTATYPPGTDLMRPKQALDLRQRPASTFMPLVHTEEVDQAAELVCDPPKLLSFEVMSGAARLVGRD